MSECEHVRVKRYVYNNRGGIDWCVTCGAIREISRGVLNGKWREGKWTVPTGQDKAGGDISKRPLDAPPTPDK